MISSERMVARAQANVTVARITVVLVSAAIAAWSAVMVAGFFGWITLPFSTRVFNALLVGPPVVAGLAQLVSSRPAGPIVRWATGYGALFAALLLLTPKVLASPSLAFAIPALLVLAFVLSSRPAVGVVALLAVTASYGSLSIYLAWPYNKTMAAILGGLWLAAIGRMATQRRRQPLAVPIGVLVAVAYLSMSAVEVLLADNPAVARGGFELAPWFMMSMLVVAYSQWSIETHMRIARWILVIAVLVGAYATLRLIIGPSAEERNVASYSIFNYVDGKQKLLGSFPNGPDLAEWTALMTPFCVACALCLRGRARTTGLVALPFLSIALFGSQQRSAAVAVAIAVLLTAVLYGSARAFQSGTRFGHAAIAVALTLTIGLGAYALAGSSSQKSGHSYLSLITGNSQDASISIHRYKWGIAFRDLAGHPFGYGLGTAPAGYTAKVPPAQYILPVTGFSVDNGYLKIALEQGFAVMVVFTLSLVLLAVGLARGGLIARDPRRATLALGAAGTTVSFMILEGAGAFADGIPAIAGWVVVGLGVAQLVQRGATYERPQT